MEELKTQIGEFASKLEDYLNGQVGIHFLLDKTKRRPTLTQGDLVFDFTDHPEFATLQQWDGKRLVPLNVETIPGYIDLIQRGIGSGTDSRMFLASKGDGHWELRIPERIEFQAAEVIPPFSLATATGRVANSNNFAYYNKVIGMVDVSVASGFIGYAFSEGELTNGAWAWTPGAKLFLNGTTLSATAPATGFSQLVAIARTSNTIIMRLAQAVLL